MTKEEIQKEITELEGQMVSPDFWMNKDNAQRVLRELEELKTKLEGGGKYDKGNAILSIFTGAGGDDAEDFSRMLYEMYLKFCDNKHFKTTLLDKNENGNGGFRSISIEVHGPTSQSLRGTGPYGVLKNESGVHRLVRISPFNAKGKRNTSFSMVEVLPKFEKLDFEIPESDLDIAFSKSGGKGGQNVNKRETAVRVTHVPTGLTAHATAERSQEANKEEAIKTISAKVWRLEEEKQRAAERGMAISATTDNEWGSQIRSYVLHPYKMVKDHRTGFETSNVEKVLERGELDEFIEAEKDL